MPTIEIASINAAGLGLNQTDFDVAILEENKLESHRSLFYDLLRTQQGAMVHIGNPTLKNNKDGGFYAGGIIDWSLEEEAYIYIPEDASAEGSSSSGANQQFIFKFLDAYKPDIDALLKAALDKSPVKKVVFLTDYQFGPEKGSTEVIETISAFWARHDAEGLKLNTLYEMYGL
jgi:hypothetical protein